MKKNFKIIINLCIIALKTIFTSIIIFTFYSKLSFSNDFEENIEIKSYIRGINLADAEAIIKIKNGIYDIKMQAKTIGIFSIFSNWEQKILANGKFRNSEFFSKMYYSEDRREKKKGHIKIIFNNGIPKLVSAQPNPKGDKRRKEIDTKLLENVVGPIAGILNLGLNNNCKKKSDVFDGKRRYSIEPTKIKTEILKETTFLKNNVKAIKCSFKINKIAGYTEKEIKKFPNGGYLWLAKFEKSNLYFPVKLKIKSSWGNFICLIKERKKEEYESNYM